MSEHRSSADYIDRTMSTVRNHRSADNCWPQWANIFADEIEDLRADIEEADQIVRRFHEAWWNWEPGDDTEPLDAAASEAMAYLGDVIRLREEPT